ncbi:ARM repeat-containing protein [Polychaeton citri CBS 116435]|uniref:ARM repeat-containing protein n=1 Tax=Polychaeton citri CBS 116435 TaxID=1314669 RepID=A0A9P4UPP8_9PEZI|nr:ARM repeat-containing protein [Polychaeton citri CBS 116435]
MTPSERAADKYERLLAEQRRLQQQIDSIDPAARREVDEGLRHEATITQMMAQSEPTTPPEMADGFPSFTARPNRYSSASLTSPPGIMTRPARASTQGLISPPGINTIRGFVGGNNLPSQSVPGSRRQSDDEDEDEDMLYSFDLHRAAANPNRNSMPATSYDRKRNTLTDYSNGLINTTSLLFDDGKPSKRSSQPITTSPPNGKTFLHLQQTADGFPKLIRREDNRELPLSASSAALDLALSQTPEPEKQLTERAVAGRHRISLPPSAYSNTNSSGIAGLNSILANSHDPKPAVGNRRSMEVKFATETKRPDLTSPPRSNGFPKPMSSYSTNDLPTLKSIGREQFSGVPVHSPPVQNIAIANATSPQQGNTTLARITSAGNGPIASRFTQEAVTPPGTSEETQVFPVTSPGLQAGAVPFGPTSSHENNQAFNGGAMSPYAQQPAFYGGYGVQMLNSNFGNMNLGNGYPAQNVQGQSQWSNGFNASGGGYNNYGSLAQGNQTVAGAGRFPEKSSAQRRQQSEDASARFNSIRVQDLKGEIFNLCKDQHGCRFLQKKLEDNDDSVNLIYEEVKGNIIDLMTDPFGNYLCQKLLECATIEQRTGLIQNAMPAMKTIALNQHGTRALQKMIEYIETPEQTELIIEALRNDVVQLIQDLNGNHVIQKCLNHLSSANAQFIFDAVGENCVTVGTHRHGCCVLQRCIDHASGLQKGELIQQITNNSFALVQDPFGNYVVQYILDLSEPAFTNPLCQGFAGSITFLSKQKFSSNVMEKCIRCADPAIRHDMIVEISPQQEMEKLLRDSFANYVVQTALDFADEDAKSVLIESIRPILPSIRNTPYGRRIQSKVTEYDTAHGVVNSGPPSGVITPKDSNATAAGPVQFSSPTTPNRGNRMGFVGAPPNWPGHSFGNPSGAGVGNNYGGPWPNQGPSTTNGHSIASPSPQRNNQAYSMLNGNATANGYPAQGFQNFPSNGFTPNRSGFVGNGGDFQGHAFPNPTNGQYNGY